MNLAHYLLMMATPEAAGGEQGGSTLMVLLPWVVIFLIFYLLLIRPQAKKQKEHKAMLDSLQKGDKVITSGGLIGTIVGTNEDIVTVKFGENFKAEVGKNYITSKVDK